MMHKQSSPEELSLAAAQHIKESDYWRKKLSGVPVRSGFPYDHKRANVEPGNEVKRDLDFKFAWEISSRLMNIVSGSDFRLHMIVVAAAVLLLDKYSFAGTGDIILGTPIYKQDIEGTFINTILVLRNQLRVSMSFQELLLQVRQTITEAVENQNFPVEKLPQLLDIPYEKGDDFPLFDVAVLLENIQDKSYLQPVKPGMIFSFRRIDEEILGTVEYNACRCDNSTILRIVDHFLRLMQNVLFNIKLPLSRVEILSEEEKYQLLQEINGSGTLYAQYKTIVQLFEEQAARTPDRIAVVEQTAEGKVGKSITFVSYSELNRRSNQLARLLRRKGVKPGSIAGLLMDRTADMIVAIWGVIKAGGTYLPIAPDTPLYRIHQVLADAHVTLLLTRTDIITRHSFSFTELQQLHVIRSEPLKTPPRTPIANLDTLPMPDRSLVDYDKYTSQISLAMVKHCISLQGTRGCHYKCAHCAKLWPRKQVVRSAENLFAEVKHYYDMGVRRFSIIDDIFNLNIENSKRFFQFIIDNRLHLQLFFPAELRGDIMTKDYIDLMVAAGTINISVALETASHRLQKLIRKNLDMEKLQQNLHYICKKHPDVILDLFTMHGLPTETQDEAMITLDFIKSLKWLHFPLINITRIYPNTDMEKLALENGISRESILRAEALPWHEAAPTLPFDKSFTTRYQTDFLNNYFLLKERLLHVLPYQMKVLTEDEIILKYKSYLPIDKVIRSLDELLQLVDINRKELGNRECVPEERFLALDLKQKMQESSLLREPGNDALRVLLLDLSQSYTKDRQLLDQLYEQPLGLMYLMTYLNREFGSKINGKIAKSGVDFDSDNQLKNLLKAFGPQVIGIRTLTFYKDFFHQTIARIRQWGFDGPIIVGGPYPTNSYNYLLQDRNIDLVVLGEGEITLSEVIGTIMKNSGQLPGAEALKNIPGIVFLPQKQKEKGTLTWDILLLDELKETLRKENGENPGHLNRPTDPVYTIFTSGSTGMPKGVVIEHRNLHNLVIGLNHRIYKKYARPLKVAMVSPYVFDASVKQVFASLLLGHTLYIVPEDIRADSFELLKFFNHHAIEITDGTPTHIKLLLESSRENMAYPGLKHLLIGGEALGKAPVEKFFQRYIQHTPLIANLYGPTECTVDATCYELSAANIRHLEEIPIGTPLPNHYVYILDTHNQNRLQPLGVPGELCIAGAGVARGYLNRPELTAEKFCLRQPGGPLFGKNHPPWTPPQKLLNKKITGKNSMQSCSNAVMLEHNNPPHFPIYLTGDLARWIPNGIIQYLGRKDYQVKIRGYRLELGEIEGLLLKHEKIKEAVVVVNNESLEGTDDRYLCAYITPADIDVESLRGYLSLLMQDYMVPSCFVPMERIPITSNGKINRKALPPPEISKVGEDYAAPRGDCQEKLTEIWSEILNIEKEKISIDANFFKIGGHSLKAAILTAHIHRTFEVKIPLVKIFENPTIRALSKEIMVSGKTTFIDLVKTEEKEYYPLSFNQKRIWVLHQLDSQGSAFNMAGIINLDDDVNKSVVQKVLDGIAARHENLRTGFKTANGKIVQFILKEVDLPVKTFDISSLGSGKKQEERDRVIEALWRPAFDLGQPPLFRAILVKLDTQRYELALSMHHIVSDGWSMEILRDEFYRLYHACRSGKEVCPGPVKLQYRDFARWQHRQLSLNAAGERAYRFWKRKLEKGIPQVNIPGDFNSSSEDRSGAAWDFMIDPELKEKIIKLAGNANTTVFNVMFTAYLLLVSRFSNQEDVSCAIINSGRDHVSLHPIMGFFVNSIIFYHHMDPEEPFLNLLQKISHKTLELFHYLNYPFELVFEQLKMKYPNIPVSFNMLNMQDTSASRLLNPFAGDHIHYYQDVKFDIETYLMEFKNGIGIRFAYKRALYKSETVRVMIEEYIKSLDFFTLHTGKNYQTYRQSGKTIRLWT